MSGVRPDFGHLVRPPDISIPNLAISLVRRTGELLAVPEKMQHHHRSSLDSFTMAFHRREHRRALSPEARARSGAHSHLIAEVVSVLAPHRIFSRAEVA
jgi:hypothetical protein